MRAQSQPINESVDQTLSSHSLGVSAVVWPPYFRRGSASGNDGRKPFGRATNQYTVGCDCATGSARRQLAALDEHPYGDADRLCATLWFIPQRSHYLIAI